MQEPRYVIKGSWRMNKDFFQGYIYVNPEDSSLNLVTGIQDSTQFTSQVLARSWLIKVKQAYPIKTFYIVNL